MADKRTLSTGHTVELPITLAAKSVGAVFSAPREQVAALLPDALAPVPTRPSRAAVTVLSVAYRRIGDDVVDPYDEFSIQIPAVQRGTRTLPHLSLLAGLGGGYVWYLPVTTEPARALGEVWGYPKEVGEISIDDVDGGARTEVTVDGERVVTMTVDEPPSVQIRQDAVAFTDHESDLTMQTMGMRGRVGAWPWSSKVDLNFGEHPRGRRLSALALSDRAVLRVGFDGEFVLGEPIAVG